MNQTERDHESKEKISEAAGQEGEHPRSWRQYMEETEAAEKRAEREAAKVRAAKARKERHGPAALKKKAQAALNEARAAAQEEPVKEKAARAAQTLRRAGEDVWAGVRGLAAGGENKAAQVLGKIRGVVARHPISPLFYVTLLVLGVCAAAFRSTYTRAYALNYNGQEIGVVSSQDDVAAIVSNVESRATDILGEQYNYDAEKLSLTSVYAAPGDLSDTAQIEDMLFEDHGPPYAKTH